MKMDVLFSVNNGSHLYGTASKSSDVDKKFIYLPEISTLLSGNKAQVLRVHNEIFDFEFIPIQKFLTDFFDGQTYTLEIYSSYRTSKSHSNFINSSDKDELLQQLFFEHLPKYINFKSMVGKAVGYISAQLSETNRRAKNYIDLVKFNQLVIELGHEIEKFGLPLSTKLSEIDKKFSVVIQLRNIINDVNNDNIVSFMELNRTNEYDDCIRLVNNKHRLNALRYDEMLGYVQKQLDSYGDRIKNTAYAGIDTKSVAHAYRLGYQYTEFIDKQVFNFPLPLEVIDKFNEIKKGDCDYEKVLEEIKNKYSVLKQSVENTETDPKLETQFSEFVSEFLFKAYNLNKN